MKLGGVKFVWFNIFYVSIFSRWVNLVSLEACFSNKFPIWLNQLAIFMCEKIMKWKAQFSDKSLRAFLVEDLLFVWRADWSRLKK